MLHLTTKKKVAKLELIIIIFLFFLLDGTHVTSNKEKPTKEVLNNMIEYDLTLELKHSK